MNANAGSLRTLSALFVLFCVVIRSSSVAAQSIAGTWTLVSETVQRDNQVVEPLGSSPLGTMMLDKGGRFMLIISRRGIPIVAANKRDAGTPEENKAILAGMLAFFGSYKASIPDGLLTIHVQASTFPNWIGSDQKRYFTLAGDEMTWLNRSPAVSGETAKLVWRRQQAE